MLSKSVDGRAILTAGSREGKLQVRERRELSRLIVIHLLADEPSKKVDSETWIDISMMISALFPKEPAILYYSPAMGATGYQKRRNAGGLLYESYISRRRKLRQLGTIQFRPRTPRRPASKVDEPEKLPLQDTSRGNNKSLTSFVCTHHFFFKKIKFVTIA